MNLYDSIFRRRSVRHYKWEPIAQRLLSLVDRYQNGVSRLDDSIQYKVEIIDNLKEQRVLKGAFKVKSPYYLVLYSELKEGSMLNGGFILEQMVLYMAMKGIGTCYQGKAKILPTTNSEGLKEIMVLSFGLPAEEVYRAPERAKRYSLKDICIFKEEAGDHIRTLLNAARMSPSSMNSQPWRFVVYNNRIHLFSRKILFFGDKLLTEADLGIALSHLMIALEELWLDGNIVKIDQISELSFNKSQYVTTLLLN